MLRSRIERNLEDANRIIVAYGGEPLDGKTIIDDTSAIIERLAPFVTDTTHFLNVAAAKAHNPLEVRRRRCSMSITELIPSSHLRARSSAGRW